MDNDLDIEMVPVYRQLSEAIDSIIEVANKNGSKDSVVTSGDWETVIYIFKVWETLYPQQASDFYKSMSFFRSHETTGVAKDKGGATIQHQLEVPQQFYLMFKVFFPKQKWDKKFVRGLSSVLPQLKANDTQL